MTETIHPEPVCSDPPVIMFTAPNPGPKTLTGSHTFVVGHEQAYLIDPGPAMESYARELIRWIGETRAQVRGILLSHGHPDHAPGAPTIGEALGVPVYASIALDEIEAGVAITNRYPRSARFTVDADILEVLPAPGHSRDHVAFFLRRARILFSGDTILGEGSTLVAPPDGDMLAYMDTLAMMRALNPRLIAPGHGPLVRDPTSKIDEYIEHRRRREADLLAALQGGSRTVPELVARLYADVDPRLHELAAGSVLAQLAKLEAEGRVRRIRDRYSAV